MFDHLSHILSTSESHSILLIERAVVGLLRLSTAISSDVRPPFSSDLPPKMFLIPLVFDPSLEQPAMQQQLDAAVELLRTIPPTILSSVVEGTGQTAEELLRTLQVRRPALTFSTLLSSD